MSARNAALELYRILCLVDAHQYHLLAVQGFFNLPENTIYFTFLLLVVSALTFTMASLFQIGTLFLIRRPFRLRGLIIFALSLQVYSRAYAAITFSLGVADFRNDPMVRFPIFGQQSWFFSSHAIMTFIAALLHPGMLALSKRSYALINVFLIGVLTVTEPDGPFQFSTYPAPGTNWMNACLLYFFAGYFAIHGWPMGRKATWVFFGVIYAVCFFCTKNDVNKLVDPQWRWLVQSFQFAFRRRKGKLKWVTHGGRVYVSPLAYIGGVTALNAAQFVVLPRTISQICAFLGPKIYVLHFLDSHPITVAHRWDWLRVKERITTPSMCLKSAVLVSVQLAMIGFILEIFKDWLFTTIIALGQNFWRFVTMIHAQVSGRRTPNPALNGRKYVSL
jgi:hypothetical protein